MAWWWLRDADAAIAERRQPSRGSGAGRRSRAGSLALWLSREYQAALGNSRVSRAGSREPRGCSASSGGPEHGWLALTRAERAADPAGCGDGGGSARDRLTTGERDLEAAALALLGLRGDRARRGRAAAGPASTRRWWWRRRGEVTEPVVFGDVCCLVTRAAEEVGDICRLERWNEVVMGFMERTTISAAPRVLRHVLRGGAPGERPVDRPRGGSSGRFGSSRRGASERGASIHRRSSPSSGSCRVGSKRRCGSWRGPRTDRTRYVRTPRCTWHGATPAISSAVLLRRLAEVGARAVAVPLLALLVEVQLAQGDTTSAATAAARLARSRAAPAWLGSRCGRTPAEGRVAAADGEDSRAKDRLAAAAAIADRLHMPLEAARRAWRSPSRWPRGEPELAGARRVLLSRRSTMPAPSPRDASGGRVLRQDGGPARTGPKTLGRPHEREQEVLQLVAEGLTNADDRRPAAPEHEDRGAPREQRARQARRQEPGEAAGFVRHPTPPRLDIRLTPDHRAGR